jgi:hypothetical protein
MLPALFAPIILEVKSDVLPRLSWITILLF